MPVPVRCRPSCDRPELAPERRVGVRSRQASLVTQGAPRLVLGAVGWTRGHGLPGIGKSTIASVFADHHPGVLNLDIDRVAAMIGGWGGSFSDSFEAGRLLAAAMARVHLASGHDVIMPQMMTHANARELADF
jgi:hypothetical protein